MSTILGPLCACCSLLSYPFHIPITAYGVLVKVEGKRRGGDWSLGIYLSASVTILWYKHIRVARVWMCRPEEGRRERGRWTKERGRDREAGGEEERGQP